MKNFQLKNKAVQYVLFSFIILGLLVLGLKVFTSYSMNTLHSIAHKFYEHPFNVSSAALNVQLNIYKIHRDMKDIVLSESKDELKKLTQKVDKHEKKVYKNLTIIKKNILGERGLKLQQKTLELFKSWKVIRDEVIELVNKDQKVEAIAITKGKGAVLVLEIDSSAYELYNYSKTKASELHNETTSMSKELEQESLTIDIILSLLYFLIVYYALKTISNYIDRNTHLTKVLEVIRDINKLIAREKTSDELVHKCCGILKKENIYDNILITLVDKNNSISYISKMDDSNSCTEFKEKVKDGWIPDCIKEMTDNNLHYSIVDNGDSVCVECPLDTKCDNKRTYIRALKYNQNIYGYLLITIDKTHTYFTNENELLDEVAEDMGYALYNIEVENSLIESEKRYHNLFKESHAIELLVDPETGEIIDANKKASSFYGYSIDELMSMNINEISTLSDDKISAKMAFAKTDKHNEFISIHKLSNGELRDVEIYTGSFIVKGGRTVIHSIIFDVTEKLALKKENQKIQEQLRLVIEATNDGIWDRNLIINELYLSPRWKEILGYKDDELENKCETWESRLHPEDKQRVISNTKNVYENQAERFKDTYRLKHKDGHWVWIEVNGLVIYDDEGKPIRMLGSHKDISEEKEFEQKIIKLKDMYNNIIDSVENVIFVKDMNFTYIACNKAFAKLAGISKELVIGKNDYEIFDKETADFFRMHDGKIFIDKTAQSNFEWVTYPDGEEVYLLTLKSPLRDLNGKMIGLVGNSADLTEQKNVEKALETEKKRYENAEKIGHVGSWEYLIETQEFSASKETKHIYGFPENSSTFSTEDVESCIPEHERVHQALIDLIENGTEYNLKFEINPYDGSPSKIILSIAELECDENHKPIKVSGFVQDITDKENTLRLLEHKKVELETVVQEAPNPIMLHNEKGRVIMVNKVWLELTGYKFKEIDTIEKWTQKAYGEKQSSVKEYIDHLYTLNHKVDEGTYEVYTKDGETIFWQFSSAPLGIMDGERAVISSATDITELKKKDEMLISQSRSAAMGDMIAMIAHQWRQPITVIAMAINNLKVDMELGEEITNEDLHEMGDDILSQTEHLSKTIDDFRNFLKPNKEKELTNVCKVMEQTIEMISKSLQNNNITLDITTQCKKEILLLPNELLQVFINIINNSKDALIESEIEDPNIQITINEDEEFVTIKVSDNGKGIPESILKRLGEPYVSSKSNSGTGLGIYMSKIIVEKHLDGILKWENLDRGACFTIKLPLSKSIKE